jgi:hypothetical protein
MLPRLPACDGTPESRSAALDGTFYLVAPMGIDCGDGLTDRGPDCGGTPLGFDGIGDRLPRHLS